MNNQLSLSFVIPPLQVEINPADHLRPETLVALAQHALNNGMDIVLSSVAYQSEAMGWIPFCVPRKVTLLINGERETAVWAQMPIEKASAVHELFAESEEVVSLTIYDPNYPNEYQRQGDSYEGRFAELVDVARDTIHINHLGYFGAFQILHNCEELPPSDSWLYSVVSPYLNDLAVGNCPESCPGTVMLAP